MQKKGLIQNKYMIRTFLKEIFHERLNRIPYSTFIYYFLSEIVVKKRVLKNKFRRAQKVN